MANSKFEFKNSTINGDIFSNAKIGDQFINSFNKGNNNEYVGGDKIVNSYSNLDYNHFTNYLEEIIKNSDNIKERKCAEKAKNLYNTNKHKELKSFIIQNITTFSTGTFATVAGGLLLNIIQNILNN